ncbi:MAG: aspartate/glutamate racemase family protein [Candidatus Levybacteria bacterium]|nr:aspartate/glutamate racemase family protein [Candidatus Levybacteria bacterium]
MKKAIGILGGMGPEASVYMLDLLISLSAKEFGAINGDEFPEVLLNSVPVPDFISSDNNKDKALKMLKKSVKRYNKKDTLCLSIACNTAHVLIPQLQKETSIPFISMVQGVSEEVLRMRLKKVGLLSTPGTLRSRLYHDQLESKGVVILTPSPQEMALTEGVIRNVIAGKKSKKDTAVLKKIGIALKKRGAEGIILGCTETPLAFPDKFPLPVFNSVEILCRSLLNAYYGNYQKSIKKVGEI